MGILSQNEFISINGEFNRSKWQSTLKEIAKKNNIDIEIIIPFGFELTEDKEYLKKKLTRLYVYISSKKKEDKKYYSKVFLNNLIETLQRDFPVFYNQIYEVDIQSEKLFLKGLLNKIIIYQRSIKNDLLIDWANYILSVPENVLNKKLPDVSMFKTNQTSRAYLFQTSIINHYLFQNGKLDEESFQKIHSLTSPRILKENSLFYIYINAFNDIIINQNKRIVEELKGSFNDLKKVEVEDYHSKNILSFEISQVKLSFYQKKIVDLYTKYGNV